MQISGQSIEEDFSNGHLDTWSGDVQDFIIENEVLRLNAIAEGKSKIFAPFTKRDTTLWALEFRLDFPPSNRNMLEVYLLAENDSLESSDALYLSIGESGSEDNIKLYKRENGTDSLIASSAPGTMASDPAIEIQVEKLDNDWLFRFRYLDSLSFTEFHRAQVDDGFLPLDNFFGLICHYTSTRKDRFFFDNIKVGPPAVDTIAPFIEELILPRRDLIALDFSEALDSSGLQSVTAQIKPAIPSIRSIEKDFGLQKRLNLILSGPLQSEQEYELSVEGLTDEAGNRMLPFDTVFQVLFPDTAEAYDLVINEIMADPTPSVGLPEAEYLEIYNRSNKVISLDGFSLSSGASTIILPDVFMKPFEYAIVTDSENAGSFQFVEKVLAIEGFFNLSNAGDDILLRNSSGDAIHFVAYLDSWYRDAERNDGGYSLEMINSSDPCLDAENWRASRSLSGGTPGFQNSVSLDSSDTPTARLLSAYPLTADTIVLRFDRRPGLKIDQLNRINIQGAEVNSLLSNPLRPNELILVLKESLLPQTNYILTLEPGFQDCIGMFTQLEQQIHLQLPEAPEVGDLIINEILTDPIPGAEDYLELHNASNKVISLESLAIRNDFNDQTVALDLEVLVFPGDHIILTENVNGVLDNYQVPNPQWVFRSDLPAFNNDEGNAQIGFLDVFGLDIIDEMNYSPDMHYEFLDDLEGISLEKLSPELDGTIKDNWHSAAQTAGYGTPTAPNSQLISASNPGSNDFKLSSDRLSPDQDGFEDVLIINYNFNKPGYKTNIHIFNDRGQLIRNLGSDVLLPRSGQIKWDGLDEDGAVPGLGIYIIVIEALHPEGDFVRKKLPCVLAKRL